ncbi:MAG TPA: aspartate carbamoyltransferase, partial [Thermoprotei archaeon]|nr:aspartate carbamoyltransferase [Thermoprotei archaeon]
AKGETFGDTIRMFDSYTDIIVVRDRREGAAKYAAEIAESPVINGGDGAHNHPTQAMIDLFTITRYRGSVDGLNIGVLGDLKYGRAAISFILGLTLYDPKNIYLISPESLRLKKEVRDYLDSLGINYFETDNLTEVITDLDVLYVTRIQKERFPDPLEYERVRGSYKVDLSILSNAKDDLMVMHPLPRVDEISIDVDETKYQYYFKQAKNGVYLRMALLKLILGD